MSKSKKLRRRILWLLAITFLMMNVIAFFHAYKFTHFTTDKGAKTGDAKKLSASEKLTTLFLGVSNPRPENDSLPHQSFQTVSLKSNNQIECWWIKQPVSKGTVALFHGYSGQKSSLLKQSDILQKLGYNTLLVDFMGSGGSEGNQTTIGYKEAEEVKTCFDFLQKQDSAIYLFGTSMGAVAIMRCIGEYSISPKGIILECPFGSMFQTVRARFRMLNVPSFPMAGLLVFWGGVENGFWAFGHNPSSYARQIHCPTLLLWGETDPKVSRGEIDEIFKNLKGKKVLKTFPLAGHDDYLVKYQNDWKNSVENFLR